MKRTYYFAYGSNLHKPRLEDRVGEVDILRSHRLQGYKLSFTSGFADIEPQQGSFVEGLLYEVTPMQLKILDRYEGLYHREYFEIPEGIVIVYVTDPVRGHYFEYKPTRTYINIILQGCVENALPHAFEVVSTFKRENYNLKPGKAKFMKYPK